MQIRNAHADSSDDLLASRAAMLGLDFGALESRGGGTVEKLKQLCISCDCRGSCELDLRRDPNDPVWETYCPITATLIALA